MTTLSAMRRDGVRLPEDVFLPAAFHMCVAFIDCFDADPLLPAELLPQPWAGTRARELLLRCRRLGLALRENREPPALFRRFDETTRDVGATAVDPRPGASTTMSVGANAS